MKEQPFVVIFTKPDTFEPQNVVVKICRHVSTGKNMTMNDYMLLFKT